MRASGGTMMTMTAATALPRAAPQEALPVAPMAEGD